MVEPIPFTPRLSKMHSVHKVGTSDYETSEVSTASEAVGPEVLAALAKLRIPRQARLHPSRSNPPPPASCKET